MELCSSPSSTSDKYIRTVASRCPPLTWLAAAAGKFNGVVDLQLLILPQGAEQGLVSTQATLGLHSLRRRSNVKGPAAQHMYYTSAGSEQEHC